ncbi:hypothetical protein D910_08812 [Dendroctonus ponderosae]|uniref:Uncharacterized protein n=1 Tax=Dendroctonus ponderosae TaxID=77166 RepID=U4UEL9_DENPD|nr:hypothetical protein D910_08812 [Dendroctonus ponderosae]
MDLAFQCASYDYKYRLKAFSEVKKSIRQSKHMATHQITRFTTALIILLVPIVIFVSYVEFNADSLIEPIHFRSGLALQRKLLINTTHCKIPDLEPFNNDVLAFVTREPYEPCSDKPLLTYTERTTDGGVKIKVNQSAIGFYSSFPVKCCYSRVLRRDGDSSVTHSECEDFQLEATLTVPSIRVTCRTIFGVVYQNVHAVIIAKDLARDFPQTTEKKWKVVLLGFDSISRLNLQRSMPRVFAHLERNFIGLKGFNKIEDNTFPNLMATLTGRSMHTLEPDCTRNASFDKCDIIWRDFSDNGFLTAYGEDEPYLNTFNFCKKGFLRPPTTVYLRPYFISAYLLPMIYKHTMGVCTGPENTAARMFNAAIDMLSTFKDRNLFLVYWLNSFSHDNVNFPSTMDGKVLEFLHHPTITEAIEDSIFFIFSDHGFRFGDIRFTYSGWLEERLPFLYVNFPKLFKRDYPELVANFQFNAQHRLITPYDFHMTLQNLLKLSNSSFSVKPSLGCPKCKSLFELVDKERTCEDAGIPQHWCTCQGYSRLSPQSPEAVKVGYFVIEEVNRLISGFSEAHKCATYELNAVETVGRSDSVEGTDFKGYLILVRSYPYAMFEATVARKGGGFELLGQISRLNRYGAYSSCIDHDVLRKYCFCDQWSTKVFSRICYLFKCPIL